VLRTGTSGFGRDLELLTTPTIERSRAVRTDADGGAVVRIRSLHKRFPVRRSWRESLREPFRRDFLAALQNVSLDVRAGEFFGLLGPNGAGKSTLFRILTGLVLPEAGEVSVAGRDVVRELGRVRQMVVPVGNEERSLFWRLSAWENVRVYAALHGLRGAKRDRRIREVLETVELTDTGNKMVGQFSSGMKQRLLLARALLARPRVLLLDEPTRSLDPVSARRFRAFLREEVVERQGCTVLLATHSAEEALELCDRIGVLNRGRLLRVGTPAELMAQVGEERYRLWVHEVDWAAFSVAIEARGLGAPAALPDEAPGWVSAELPLAGGMEEVGKLLKHLVSGGVSVGRVEPVRLSLADLIERVVAAPHEEESGRA
jgi:ABC-2 type transport system ATP-binding protein